MEKKINVCKYVSKMPPNGFIKVLFILLLKFYMTLTGFFIGLYLHHTSNHLNISQIHKNLFIHIPDIVAISF